MIGRSARHESGSTHHLLNSAVARFSYPDRMYQPARHSLTPITPQASWWECCGTLLHPKDDPACFDASDADLFFDAVGDPRFYVMRIRRRRPVLTTMTRHDRVSQCLGSADAQPWWIAIAPSTDQGCSPPLSSIVLLKINPGEGLKLHPGTWHAGPFIKQKTALFYNLELRTTNQDDHNSCGLSDVLELKLE